MEGARQGLEGTERRRSCAILDLGQHAGRHIGRLGDFADRQAELFAEALDRASDRFLEQLVLSGDRLMRLLIGQRLRVSLGLFRPPAT